MNNYNRNNRSGGRGRFGGGDGGDFRRRDSGRREMHSAVCDECGKNCEVPFRPSGDKPIYCSNCFENKEGGSRQRSSRGDSRGPRFEKRDDSSKKLLEQASYINEKLDRILKVLESSVAKEGSPKAAKVKKVAKNTTSKAKKSKKVSKKKAK